MEEQRAKEFALKRRLPVAAWSQARAVTSILVLLLNAHVILRSSRSLKSFAIESSVVFQTSLTNATIAARKDIPRASVTAPVTTHKHDNPESQADGIAACLMLLEDSIQLTEWIACHCTTLPLSSLIIGMDPKNSKRTIRVLNELFSKWNETVGLEIQTWHHPTHCMDAKRAKSPMHKKSEQALLEHQFRQRNFNNKCSLHHKQAGRHWTVAIDTDEFVSCNCMNPIDEDLDKTDSFLCNVSKPVREELPLFRTQDRTVLDLLRHCESLHDDNSTLKDEAHATGLSFAPQRCIRMAGLRFSNQPHGSQEDSNTTGTDDQNGLLMTMSCKTHELPKKNFTKILHDLSKIPLKEI